MKRFFDWRVVYYNKFYDKIKTCKCMHMNDHSDRDAKLFNDYDMKDQSSVEFIFDMIDDKEKEHLTEFYVMPVDLLDFVRCENNDDDDLEDVTFDDIVSNYIKFDEQEAKTTFSVLQRQKNERLMANERLHFYFKCHVYHFNLSTLFSTVDKDKQYNWKANGNTRVITNILHPGLLRQILDNVPTVSFVLTLVKPTGLSNAILLNIRMNKLIVYNNSAKSQTALANISNQPFDDLEPLINVETVEIDDDISELVATVAKIPNVDIYNVMHNLSSIVMNEDDIGILQKSFFMTDNLLHILLKETMDKCEDSLEMAQNNSGVFVCNTMLMAQLCTASTPFAEVTVESLKKQVEWIFTHTISQYCTYHDELKQRQSCLLSKDFLFFPVNSHGPRNQEHWALYMCYKPFDRKEKAPLIYIIDSLYDCDSKMGSISHEQHSINVLKLRMYLQCVADKYGMAYGGAACVTESRRAVIMRTPQQPYASNACGMYVSMFVDEFVKLSVAEKHQLVLDKHYLKDKTVFADKFVNIQFLIQKTFKKFQTMYSESESRKKVKLTDAK